MGPDQAYLDTWNAAPASTRALMTNPNNTAAWARNAKDLAASSAAFGGLTSDQQFDFALGKKDFGAPPPGMGMTSFSPVPLPSKPNDTPNNLPPGMGYAGATAKNTPYMPPQFSANGAPASLPPGMGYAGATSTTPGGAAWSAFNPWGGQGAAGNENRSISYQGLDPRLDAFFGYGLGEAANNYQNQKGQGFYGGQTVAGLSPEELQAQRYMMQLAGNSGDTAASGMGFLDSLLANGQNPGQNPQVDAAINATLRDVTRQATDPGGVFSQIRGNSLSNGAYGGSRQGVLESLALGRLADSLGKTSATMRLDARGQDINAGLSGIQNQGNFSSLASLPASLMSGVGAQNRNMNQAFMNDALTRWLYETNQPNVALQNYMNAGNASPLGGWGGGSSWLSDAALNSGGGTSTAQNVVGGVAAGAGIYGILRDAGLI